MVTHYYTINILTVNTPMEKGLQVFSCLNLSWVQTELSNSFFTIFQQEIQGLINRCLTEVNFTFKKC